MRPSVLAGLFFLMTLGTACVDDKVNDPEADGVPANRVNKPFYVAVFDHTPTEDEIQADFERFLLASKEISTVETHYPGPWQDPQPGQKLVRIDATTGAGEFAGTHQASLFKFRGTWERDSGLTESEDFVLDNPNVDDLEQDTVSIFRYLLPEPHTPPMPLPYHSDRFLRGRIVTISENGWHCDAIDLHETNYLWVTRNQHLPFDQMIDYPARSPSDPKPATNSSWLKYD
jgi:hypothetical protein